MLCVQCNAMHAYVRVCVYINNTNSNITLAHINQPPTRADPLHLRESSISKGSTSISMRPRQKTAQRCPPPAQTATHTIPLHLTGVMWPATNCAHSDRAGLCNPYRAASLYLRVSNSIICSQILNPPSLEITLHYSLSTTASFFPGSSAVSDRV